eukprot:Hpha_TRINITY_DN15180_c2_g12::TRINITY_DN15180_c2_g12_i1::g.127888::m.127888/K03434/PIGL; N-acetylglucosaminylphosphatidylinositol deacetylase
MALPVQQKRFRRRRKSQHGGSTTPSRVIKMGLGHSLGGVLCTPPTNKQRLELKLSWKGRGVGGDGSQPRGNGRGKKEETANLFLLISFSGCGFAWRWGGREEMERSAKEFEAELVQVDDPELRDGMKERWSHEAVVGHVKRSAEDVQAILTFDDGGVSGHPNHRDTAEGVLRYVTAHPTHLWRVRTEPPFPKYLGALSLLAPDGLTLGCTKGSRWRSWVPPERPWACVGAMLVHKSQLVWYRWLYVLFVRYAFVVDVDVLHPPSSFN